MSTRKTIVTLHEVPLYISEYHLGSMADVSFTKSKAGIDSGDVEIIVTVTRKHFIDIPNVLIWGGRSICILIEGHLSVCWTCGAECHLSKACPEKRPESQQQSTTFRETAEAGKRLNVVKDPGEWTEEGKKRSKAATTIHQHDVPKEAKICPGRSRYFFYIEWMNIWRMCISWVVIRLWKWLVPTFLDFEDYIEESSQFYLYFTADYNHY